MNDVLYTAKQVYTFIHCPSFFSSSSLVYGSVIFLLLNPPNTLLRHCLYVYVVKKRKKVTDPIYNKIILRFYLYSNNKYKNKIKPIYELSSQFRKVVYGDERDKWCSSLGVPLINNFICLYWFWWKMVICSSILMNWTGLGIIEMMTEMKVFSWS